MSEFEIEIYLIRIKGRACLVPNFAAVAPVTFFKFRLKNLTFLLF